MTSSVVKLMILEMKLSFMIMALMDLQSLVGSPSNRQMLSIAIFTIGERSARSRAQENSFSRDPGAAEGADQTHSREEEGCVGGSV